MQAGPSPAREARLRHRQAVRTLTYVTLDQGNGGILLNLTRNGVAVQTVAAVRMGQQVQVRFDVLAPRVRVNARGEVAWATSSGRCGIRFLDLSPQTGRQLDEWTFAKLLEGTSPFSSAESVFAPVDRSQASSAKAQPRETHLVREDEGENENFAKQSDGDEPVDSNGENPDDNLIISAGRVRTIELPTRDEARLSSTPDAMPVTFRDPGRQSAGQLDWLSQPLSGRSLAWTVNTLVVTAAWLLCVLVFLSVLREIPKWPIAMVSGAAVVVVGLYWGFFRVLAGATLGEKLARIGDGSQDHEDPDENCFR